jgi:hypothetical protein
LKTHDRLRWQELWRAGVEVFRRQESNLLAFRSSDVAVTIQLDERNRFSVARSECWKTWLGFLDRALLTYPVGFGPI